ncbi:unnamed protein product [Rotaria sordida]|uniref:Uncharacterized protein n=1 Tax=Rotaria sordida TaxID=392033 RepID=A0A814NCB6_9BILA|nr:unnamed protein product [Rotaria sordida]CAF1291508.1 unnamed protein product [Rotaria sordida]
MHFLSKFPRFSISNVRLFSSIRQKHSLDGSESGYHHVVSNYQIHTNCYINFILFFHLHDCELANVVIQIYF